MIRPHYLLIFPVLTLAACESAKDELGLNRRSPDEFAVYQRAPLELPPDYTLRPPIPGIARPQETAPIDQATVEVVGASRKATAPSTAESVLLRRTQADRADPSVRATLDAETRQIEEEEKPTLHRVLGLGGSGVGTSAKVVDPVEESKRLKTTQKTDLPNN